MHLGFIFVVVFVEIFKRDTLAKPSIRSVALVSRHGDRGPTASYPKDPYVNYVWQEGFGALTTKGSRQMYKSGLIKAARYGSLSKGENGTLDVSRIYVRSSCVERCVKSAQSFLDGFLLEHWPSNLLNVVPRSQDEFLVITGRPCPKYISTIEDGYRIDQPEIVRFLKTTDEFPQFSDYIQNSTGLNMTSLRTLYILEDIINIQLDNGLRLPAWAESVFAEYVKPISQFTFNKRGASRYMQIRSGVFLGDIINRLEKSIKGSSQDIFLYVAHDLTQSALSILLGILDQTNEKPAFGSTLAFELYDNPLIFNDFEIKLFYFMDYSDENPRQINIPNCEAICSFSRFKEILKRKLVLDYDERCRL